MKIDRSKITLLIATLFFLLSCSKFTEKSGCSPKIDKNGKTTVTIGIFQPIITLVPRSVFHSTTANFLHNIFEQLIVIGDDLEPKPLLAKRWEFIDALTLDIYLREGVKFHNNKTMDAHDVITSLQDSIKNFTRYRITYFSEVIGKIEYIDKLQIRLHLTRSSPIILYYLPSIVVTPADIDLTSEPIGTGPYFFVKQQDNVIELKKFPNYHSKNEGPDTIKFVYFKNKFNAIKEYNSCKVDMLADVPIEIFQTLKIGSKGKIEKSISVVTYLSLSPLVEQFRNIKVREAIDLALDREKLVKELLKGEGKPANQMFPPTVIGYDPTIPPKKFDPTLARKILKEELPSDFSVDLYFSPDKNATPIIEMFENVGLKVEPKPTEWPKLFQLKTRPPLYFGGFKYSYDTPMVFFDSYLSNEENDSFPKSYFENVKISALLTKLTLTHNISEIKTVIRTIGQLLTEEKYIIPLFYTYDLYFIQKYLEQGFHPNIDTLGKHIKIIKDRR